MAGIFSRALEGYARGINPRYAAQQDARERQEFLERLFRLGAPPNEINDLETLQAQQRQQVAQAPQVQQGPSVQDRVNQYQQQLQNQGSMSGRTEALPGELERYAASIQAGRNQQAAPQVPQGNQTGGSYDPTNAAQQRELMAQQAFQKGQQQREYLRSIGVDASEEELFKVAVKMLGAPDELIYNQGAADLKRILDDPTYNYFTQGIPGNPQGRQNARIDPQGNIQPFGTPYEVGSGQTFNFGSDNPGTFMSQDMKRQYGFPADSVVWIDPKTGPKVVEQFNDSHRKAASYGLEMFNAISDLDELVQKGFQAPTLTDSIINETGIQSWLKNIAQTEEGQYYQNIVNTFINAVLRKKSGATITDEEYRREYPVYFPIAGDSPADIEQKRMNREIAMSAIIQESGGLFESYLKEHEKRMQIKGAEEERRIREGNVELPSVPQGNTPQIIVRERK